MKNGDFGAISEKGRHIWAAPISKVERHIIGKVPHFIEWMNENEWKLHLSVYMFLAISYMGDTVK